MTDNSHCPDVTMDEALKRLKLGGDMDMLVDCGGGIKLIFQVRDDHLLVCAPGVHKTAHSGTRLMTSEKAVLELIIAVAKNALNGGETHVVMH